MKHIEFSIGTTFFTATGQWRCTDTGTRTIVAIKISDIEITTVTPEGIYTRTETPSDPSWFNGPPYAVAEQVFDEYDLEGCRLTEKDFQPDPPALNAKTVHTYPAFHAMCKNQ